MWWMNGAFQVQAYHDRIRPTMPPRIRTADNGRSFDAEDPFYNFFFFILGTYVQNNKCVAPGKRAQ